MTTTHRDPDTGAVRITPTANGNGGGKRALISIDRETRILVPLGALAALVYLIWTVSSAWNSQSLEVQRLRADLSAHVADNVEDAKITDIRIRKLEGSLLGQQPQQQGQGDRNGTVRSMQAGALLASRNGDDQHRQVGHRQRPVGQPGVPRRVGGDARQVPGRRQDDDHRSRRRDLTAERTAIILTPPPPYWRY